MEATDLMEAVDMIRREAARSLSKGTKSAWGQFFTPAPLAVLMASLPDMAGTEVALLDAGAGAGSLLAAAVARLCRRKERPRHIRVTAYEIDSQLGPFLARTLALCQDCCGHAGITFEAEVRQEDFLQSTASLLSGSLFLPGELSGGLFPPGEMPGYTCALLNPPYRKIQAASAHRQWLRQIGVETGNLYTGFMAAALRLLAPGGELVVLSPRSFCNGPYFRSFRHDLLDRAALRHLHLFESREQAFREDDVLQENLILHAVKTEDRFHPVTLSTSSGAESTRFGLESGSASVQKIPYAQIVQPGDPQRFIRLPHGDAGEQVARRMAAFSCSLTDLGLSVSTGRVVDFRVREFLRTDPGPGCVPLIYSTHLREGRVCWPRHGGKKANALLRTAATEAQLVSNDWYVLVKRFSAKEEPKRVVATVHDPARLPGSAVGFENHLNYYHRSGAGLEPGLARGLAAFLNSGLVDAFFRQFSGHTQVNATDLRALPYPSLTQLEVLGKTALGEGTLGEAGGNEAALEALVAEAMADANQ